jgi:hypothetical protein
MEKIKFVDTVIPMPLMKLPVRSVIVKLSNANILISPGSRLTEKDYKEMGNITDVIAPNLFHCGGIAKAKQFLPEAKTWGVVGVKKLKPEIKWSEILEPQKWPYNKELEMIAIQGISKINEVLFFHPETKSLIVTDLCFNIRNTKGFGPWLILNLFGTYNRFGISKFFLKYADDKKAFINSMENLLKIDFENIIVSHGENVMGGAKELLIKALKERGLTSSGLT